jgi:uncharacterized oxidoreductase
VLITGGATGIGLAMAGEFVKAGSEVIVCGRTDATLKEAKARIPSLHIKKCNVANEAERDQLYEWAVAHFQNLNILVNNAGIQRMIDFRKGTRDILSHRAADGEDEIEVNLKAPVYLTALFVPHLISVPEGLEHSKSLDRPSYEKYKYLN